MSNSCQHCILRWQILLSINDVGLIFNVKQVCNFVTVTPVTHVKVSLETDLEGVGQCIN